MSDCYVGCDRSVPVKLRVMPLTRAVAEGREAKAAKAQQQWSDDDKSEGEHACGARWEGGRKGCLWDKRMWREGCWGVGCSNPSHPYTPFLLRDDGQAGGEEQGSVADDSSGGSDGDDYDSDETGELETGDEASDAGDDAGGKSS
jgi:translocation protein SEC63